MSSLSNSRNVIITRCVLSLRRVHVRKISKQRQAEKNSGPALTLQHFDDFYKSLFGVKWPSIRLALLCPNKYVAVVNNYGEPEKTIKDLECLGAVNIKSLFEIQAKRLEKIKLTKLEEEARSNVVKHVEAKDILVEKKTDSDSHIISEQEVEASEHSLNYSLSKASLESDRIVDPTEGHNTGALFQFVPADKIQHEDKEFIPESEHFKYISENDVPFKLQRQLELNFPEHLKICSFEEGNISGYPKPKSCVTGVSNYCLLDGGSVLPVLALDLKLGDVVLDMCSAPGGKALMMYQTLCPKVLVCNDVSGARITRIREIFKEFLYDYDSKWNESIIITKDDAAVIQDRDIFNKILVDVPCTNDRHSLTEEDNNIFKKHRIRERLKLPEIQSNILTNALDIVSPGGIVVYSTCTISPVQNDGVVQASVRRAQEKTGKNFTVINMTPALKRTSVLYNYSKKIASKFGTLVLPFLPSNFGPLYFCKIRKEL